MTLNHSLVVESRGDRGIPQVVERWGNPDASKCVLAVSLDDSKKDPVCVLLFASSSSLSTFFPF